MPSAATSWFLVAGVLLVLMALAGSVLKRLPLSTAILYLLAGVAVGPYGWKLARLDPLDAAPLLEVLSEVAVLVSLFTTGLKLGPPLTDRRWWVPIRLAFGGMALTVGLIAFAGVTLLGLPLGAAILLGAILAPTDPVLASDVQVEHHEDRDRLRFGLSGEAGLNDGTAFPFVMLGLGLLGLHDLGSGIERWVAVDVLWAVAGGLGVGFGMGWLIARLVLHLRRVHKEAVGLDEFLTLGLIALSYGVALLLHTYGFLAVFAAGLALRRIERHESDRAEHEGPAAGVAASPGKTDSGEGPVEKESEDEQVASDPATDAQTAPGYLVKTVLSFNAQLERIGEVTLVLLLGAMLTPSLLPADALWFVPLLFLVIRPAAVVVSLARSRTTRMQRMLMAWFGIRGIGSVYYLTYAINHGLPEPLAREIAGLVFATVAVSIFVHGISVTPIMNRYQEKGKQH
ncbi:MAG TPA: sodium:proton antiporter [Armatimonadaceae bacterium]|nr:sodium:proton antiporter [Armatimonadaceae bacterium]